jgi:hypothetical protein
MPNLAIRIQGELPRRVAARGRPRRSHQRPARRQLQFFCWSGSRSAAAFTLDQVPDSPHSQRPPDDISSRSLELAR